MSSVRRRRIYVIIAAMDQITAFLSQVVFTISGNELTVGDLLIVPSVLLFWVRATSERGLRGVRSDLRFRITELFDEAGIVIAFPQRDIHLDGRLVVESAPRPDSL